MAPLEIPLPRFKSEVLYQKMASTNEVVSKDEKSFSFKIAKSKKTSALSLENHNSTFKEKKEDQDDIDYVVSTEGKQFKR